MAGNLSGLRNELHKGKNKSVVYELFICLFIYLLSSESFVRLFIRTKHLQKETEEVIEEGLTKAVQKYLKLNDHSGDNCAQAMKSFTDHLINVYKLHPVVAGMGIFYSQYLILRRSYWSMFSVVCQQYRMRANSNNRKIVTMVRMFILCCNDNICLRCCGCLNSLNVLSYGVSYVFVSLSSK